MTLFAHDSVGQQFGLGGFHALLGKDHSCDYSLLAAI